jgi:alkylation response protein AidB-like acyl-CoA dehydrogenase
VNALGQLTTVLAPGQDGWELTGEKFYTTGIGRVLWDTRELVSDWTPPWTRRCA